MTTLTTTTTVRRSPNVLAHQVDPDDATLVLLAPKSGEYYTLEAVGTRAWQLCDGQLAISDIAATIASEYNESQATVEGDILELLQELLDETLVVIVD
jgi:Coenzyme PQQ synthesis protein D (PqqD)